MYKYSEFENANGLMMLTISQAAVILTDNPMSAFTIYATPDYRGNDYICISSASGRTIKNDNNYGIPCRNYGGEFRTATYANSFAMTKQPNNSAVFVDRKNNCIVCMKLEYVCSLSAKPYEFDYGELPISNISKKVYEVSVDNIIDALTSKGLIRYLPIVDKANTSQTI